MLTSIRLRYSRFLCNQVLPELAYVASPVTAHQSKRIKQLPKVTSAALQYEAPKMYSDCIAMMCESSHDGHRLAFFTLTFFPLFSTFLVFSPKTLLHFFTVQVYGIVPLSQNGCT